MDNNLYTYIVQICRTCMKEITDAAFFYLDVIPSANTQLTIRQRLHNCIPELDLSIVPNPVMCNKCVDKLFSVFEFKKKCLETEIQINKYIQQVQPISDLNLVEVVRFHQSDIKNLNVEVKLEVLDITEGFRNEDLVPDTSAFNEASECTESFHQPNIKNLDIEMKIEDIKITENFKNETLVCDGSAFNEVNECTERTEPKYLLELQKVEIEDVLFNTFDDYNISYNLSAAEENSNTHNNNIAKNCLREVIEHQDHNYCKNLNKTSAYYQCCRCGHKAESKLKLILHLKHHTQKNFYHEKIISRKCSKYHKNKTLICCYRCILCNYLTKYKNLFDFHIRIHLIKKNYKHIFKLTNIHTKAFRTTIKVNETIMQGSKRNRVKNCNNYHKHSFKKQSKSKKFEQHLIPRINSLKPNMRSHVVEKLFKCSICEYYSNFKVSLNEHMRIHVDDVSFSCSICKYQYNHSNDRSDLKKHMLIHTADKKFSCFVCNYKSSCKSNLEKHILIHTGEKPFSCAVCKYQCSQKSNLKIHMLIHTGEKPFLCSVCNYQFSIKSNLKKHILIHTGEKPFSCSVCKYQCSRKSSLKAHMLIHTGEKPFSCSVCEYQCNQKSNLKQHMKIHT